MRIISDAELKRQIARESKRWALHPMVSAYGSVLVAEDIPAVIPLTNGLNVLTRIRRDITGISQEYPWSSLLRNRRHKAERTAALRAEITHARRILEHRRRKEALYRELASDVKAKNKGRIIIPTVRLPQPR
jgi:hypothetical protein